MNSFKPIQTSPGWFDFQWKHSQQKASSNNIENLNYNSENKGYTHTKIVKLKNIEPSKMGSNLFGTPSYRKSEIPTVFSSAMDSYLKLSSILTKTKDGLITVEVTSHRYSGNIKEDWQVFITMILYCLFRVSQKHGFT